MSRPLHRSACRAALLLAAAILLPAGLHAQDAPPPADPADVESVDAILEAVYDVISGPAGEARDWDRFHSLFLPGARLIPSGPRNTGGYGHIVNTPAEYVQNAGPILVRDGFFEREIHRVQERFGPLVHAFSTYEARRQAEDPEPFLRGVNSFQLHHDGERWWIVTIYWFAEDGDHPLPERYLPGG